MGYDKHHRGKERKANSRNGHSQKRVMTNHGKIDVAIPRDRAGDFEPQLLERYQTRFDGIDDKIISLYAKGLSVRDIQAELSELYGDAVSNSLISQVTDSVLDDVHSWQCRSLDSLYPMVYLDCLVVKVREDNRIIKKSVYLALGVNADGHKELLGMWLSQNEGAKFWLQVLTELQQRGLETVFIFCVDGLTGFPDAIESVYPKAKVQLCVVYKIRSSLRYVSWKDRKALVIDLKKVYGAKTLTEAELALGSFAQTWDEK